MVCQRIAGALLLMGFLATPGCREPIVPRGPAQLYQLAREQIRNENYLRAADTLARLAREFPDAPEAVRATLTRWAILAGLARSSLALGQLYRTSSERTAVESDRGELATAARNHFALAQSWSLALLDAVDQELPRLAGQPLLLDPLLPLQPPPEQPVERMLRAGLRVRESDRQAIERDTLRRAFAEVMAALAGARGDFARAETRLSWPQATVEPVDVFLTFGQEFLHLSALFAREGLDQPGYFRLFHEKALALAETVLAHAAAGSPEAQAAQEIRAACQRALRSAPAS